MPEDDELLRVINRAHNHKLDLDIMVGDMFGGTTPSDITYNASTLSYTVGLNDEKSINLPRLLNLSTSPTKTKEKSFLGFSEEQSLISMTCILKSR